MINFACPTCGHGLRVKTELAGKKGKCLKCGQALVVPAQATSRVPAGDAAGLLDEKTLAPRDAPDAATLPPANTRTVAPAAKDNTNLADGQDQDIDAFDDRSFTEFLAPARQAGEIGRLGMYRILKVLGAGGMGVVFKAEDPGLKRIVAVKAMLPAIAASMSAKKRFVREARAAAAIRHNNIVTIFQVGEDRGVPFLAMEFLEGESLDDRLKREASLPLADVMRIGREMAEGLAAAHERGLIHRDIKPANTWLESSPGRKASPGRESGEFHVKILDFGLARSTDDQAHLTQSGSIIGTPAYMAPEQGRGEKLDARCDLWSLGVVLYRMCTGNVPFQGADTVSTLMAVAMNNPSPPAQIDAHIPAGLSQLVMNLLKKDPAERIASAQEVVETLRDLEKISEGRGAKGGTKRKDTARAKGKSRSPLLLALAGGVVAVVIACLVMLWPPAREAKGTGDPGGPADGQVKVTLPTDAPPPKDNPVKLAPPLPEYWAVSMAQKFQGHFMLVRDVALSSDGKLALTGSYDKAAMLWDTGSGKRLQTFAGHLNYVLAVALSGDGKFAVTGSSDKTAILWEAASGKRLNTFHGHFNSVTSVALSGEGKELATGSMDKTAIVWDTANGTKRHILEGHTAPVTGVALSGDAKLLVTGSSDKTAILWDTVSGKNLQTFQGHLSPVNSVAISADGKQVVTGSVDKTAILWDAASGARLQTFQGHTGSIHGVALRGDGKLLVTGSFDKTAILWNAATGKILQTIYGHTDKINGLAMSGDGKYVVTGSTDMTAILWEVKGSSVPVPVSPPPPPPPPPVYEPLTGAMVQRFQGHTSQVRGVALKGDGMQVVTGSWDKTAALWNAANGTKLQTFQGHLKPVHSVALRYDGKQVVTGSEDMTAILWDSASGARLQTLQGHTGVVFAVALSGDGKRIVTGSLDRSAILWDAAGGTKLQTLQGHTDAVRAVALNWDGQRILTGSGDKTAILWDAVSGAKLQTFAGHLGLIRSVALSGDGLLVLTGSEDKTASVWNAATGTRIRTFAAHFGAVTSVAFSGDGKFALTGSDDKTAILWEVASGRKLQTCQGHSQWVLSVALSADGQRILTGSGDFSAILWAKAASALPAKEVFNVPGTLTQFDILDPVRKKQCKIYNVQMVAGKTYEIDMMSTVIDPYLRLVSPKGLQVAQDDDSGGFPNARIIYFCQQSGLYRIHATTYAGGTGNFTLTVGER